MDLQSVPQIMLGKCYASSKASRYTDERYFPNRINSVQKTLSIVGSLSPVVCTVIGGTA